MFKKKKEKEIKKEVGAPENLQAVSNITAGKQSQNAESTDKIVLTNTSSGNVDRPDSLSTNSMFHDNIPSQTNPSDKPVAEVLLPSNSNRSSESTGNFPEKRIIEQTKRLEGQYNLFLAHEKYTDKESEVHEPDESIKDTDTEMNRLLLTIVTGFSDYFYEVAENIFEKRPQKVIFDSVRSDRKIGITGIQLVSVNFSTEFGVARAGLAVKILDNPSKVPIIVEKTNFMANRLERFKHLGISTPRIVFHKNQILVLEGINGESFRHSSVPITEKFRMAGKCLAALCGPAVNASDTARYRTIEGTLVTSLPVDEQLRSQIAKKLAEFPLELCSHKAGAISFGDFHSGNLLYEINLYKSPILNAHLIDPEFLETSPIVDRFLDIANFFVNRAIQEFQLKGNLFQIIREVRSFLAGYNEVLAYDLMSLDTFYPHGDTFNYYLATGILFSILNLMEIESMATEYFKNQIDSRINLVMLLLNSQSIIAEKSMGIISK